jgi:hypothetical protein
MSFEQEISQAFETLTARVRGEVDREVERVSAALVSAARRDARDEGFAAGRDEGFTAGRDEGRRETEAAMPPPREEPALPPVDTAAGERLVEAMRVIEHARSLTGILDALITGVRADGARGEVWLVRGRRLHQWREPAAGADALPDRPYVEPGEMADGALEMPIAIAGQTVAVLRAELGTGNVELRTQRIDVLTRYAARCLESLTAFTTARALTQRPAGADAAGTAAPDDEAGAEEDASARRYARLLVSEIKLYHESAVVDGRRDRDLTTRLGGEIARARVMYEQRVAPHVRLRADYFRDELVRTLANGDASLLELRTKK